MRGIDRVVERCDRVQRRHSWVGFVWAVAKKFGDDRGGMLAGLMAYYGFLALFPLLLLLITIVGLATGGNASAVHRVEHSALSQFPIIGPQLGTNIHELHDRAGVGLAIGIVGLVWGSQGAAQSTQYAMAEVWAIPLVERPGFLPRLLRSLAVLGTAGAFLLAGTALAGVVTVGTGSGLATAGAATLSFLLNVGLFTTSFRVLTPSAVRTSWLIPGALVAAAGWTVLQYAGGVLVDHALRHTSQVYGFFAIVLGLLAWIYLGAQLTVYAAELNVVRHGRLWPRSLRPPLTDADREVLRRRAVAQRARPEERIAVSFDAEDPGADRAAEAERIGAARGRPPA